MKKLMFYLPLLLALAFVAVGCDNDDENTIDSKLVGRWKLVTIIRTDTTAVTNDEIVEISSNGLYRKTVDGDRSEAKKIKIYEGSYKGNRFSGKLIRISDDLLFKYYLSDNNNTLVLEEYPEPGVCYYLPLYSYTYQRIE